jgi:hypothetical protein
MRYHDSDNNSKGRSIFELPQVSTQPNPSKHNLSGDEIHAVTTVCSNDALATEVVQVGCGFRPKGLMQIMLTNLDSSSRGTMHVL